MGNKRGNTLIVAIIFIAIIIIIFMFIIAVYFGIVNSLLYNIKLDMYTANKSAVMSVNKGVTSRQEFDYDIKKYEEYLKKQIAKNYKLDTNLESDNGIIQKVELVECTILNNGDKDSVTKKRSDDNIIHSVLRVQVKPLILEEQLKNICTFEIHEDVALNLVNNI